MTFTHDVADLDCDAPIPYTVTARGRRELQELKLDRSIASYEQIGAGCDHAWAMDRGALVCRNCGAARQFPRAYGIPGHISRKPGER